MQKKWDWEKKSIFVQNFLKISTKQIVVKPSWWPLWIIQSSYGTILWPISPTYFLTGFHRNWVWWPTTCLKMLLKMVQNCSIAPIFGGLWRVLLPFCYICLALIGYFCQNMWFIPGRFWYCNFWQSLCFSKFLFQTFLKISQHLLVFWKKL